MRKATIFVHGISAALFEELEGNHYCITYDSNYTGAPISLTLPVQEAPYDFTRFPAYFEGVLPEGIQLEALLRKYKLDKNDYFGQLLQVGHDLVGAVTVEEII